MKLVRMTSWLRLCNVSQRYAARSVCGSVSAVGFGCMILLFAPLAKSQEYENPFPSEDNTIQSIPVVDIPQDLSDRLEALFQNILRQEEELDAFDEDLGESYIAYAGLLSQVGRLDEARDMYAKALHVSKVNNGVYSLEQRPILGAMFNLHDTEGNLEEMEAALSQILWLERKNPDAKDDYSYDFLLRMGSAFIELYYKRPRLNEESLAKVQKAIRYLQHAVHRHPHMKLSESQQPYGDLALLHYISGQINKEMGRAFQDQPRIKGFADQQERPLVLPTSNFIGKAAKQLDVYLDKANKEESPEHIVRALRDKGDLFLLYGRTSQASYYYRQAWEAAAELDDDHELVKAFQVPARLPDFNYSRARLNANADVRSIYVPLNFDVDKFGRVRKIYTKNGEGPYPKMVVRARRVAKATTYRPVIDGGEMIAAKDVYKKVRVRLRSSEQLSDFGVTE